MQSNVHPWWVEHSVTHSSVSEFIHGLLHPAREQQEIPEDLPTE